MTNSQELKIAIYEEFDQVSKNHLDATKAQLSSKQDICHQVVENLFQIHSQIRKQDLPSTFDINKKYELHYDAISALIAEYQKIGNEIDRIGEKRNRELISLHKSQIDQVEAGIDKIVESFDRLVEKSEKEDQDIGFVKRTLMALV